MISKLFFGKWHNILNRTVQSILISRSNIMQQAHKIQTAEIISYPFPDEFPSFFIRTHIFPDRYVFELENITIVKESGVLLTAD